MKRKWRWRWTGRRRARRCGTGLDGWAWYFGLPVLTLSQARSEDQAGYRHESYLEQDDRIRVETESLLVQKILAPWLDLKTTLTYDAISGATPTGAPPPDQTWLRLPGSTATVSGASFRSYQRYTGVDARSGASPAGSSALDSSGTLPTATLSDERWAFDLAAGLVFGPHRLTPGFSYSTEMDYVSRVGSLNYSLELNQKNTTLNVGWAHAADEILPNSNTFLTTTEAKTSDDVLVGVSQLLGPKTVFAFSFTFGHTTGYLNDPYRGVIFQDAAPASPGTLYLFPENRPDVRDREVALASLTQAVTPLRGSAELSYRYYHDSFEIHGHTVNLAWHQKLGRFLVLTPSFRYYRQSAASFYATEFPGDPVTNPAGLPEYYSADYRLSELESFTIGIEATVKVREWLGLDFGYQRYFMRGLDGVTSSQAYPSADVISVGARVWF